MLFHSKYEAIAFSDNGQRAEVEIEARSIERHLQGTKLPDGVKSVIGVTSSLDDAQPNSDAKLFVSVQLEVEASTEAVAEKLSIPTAFLDGLAEFAANFRKQTPAFTLDQDSWEHIETFDAEPQPKRAPRPR